MKPIGLTTSNDSSITEQPYNLTVIPAKLHDVAEEVYNDVLYSLYTVSTQIIGTEINVSVIASDLVKHTAGNGIKGYWVGVGIHSSMTENSDVYVGWGKPVDAELLTTTPATPDGEQSVGEEVYKTFYFNAENAAKFDNSAFVVVVKDNIHYHYNLDLSQVGIKKSEEPLDPVVWSATSVDKLKNNYLFGINLADSNGNPLPEELFVHYMNSAVDYIQNLLDITISETEFTERHDYIRNDYQNWGFIELAHKPVKEVKRLTLTYGNRPSVEIPLDWIQLDKLTGQITLFPSAGSANSLIIGQTGMLFGFQSQWDYAPQLWEVEYVAGIDEKDPSMPVSLLTEAVYKRCACGVLNVWGDLIIGAGIANQSVSIDGVSQSIGTTQSAMYGGASARVQEYTKDLNETILPVLRQKFGGIRMVVV